MTILRNLKNGYLLWYYTRTVKKYDKKVNIREIKANKDIKFLKLKIGRKLTGLIITSQGDPKGITRIELMWANPTLYHNESEAYQNIYDTLMQWQHLFMTPKETGGLKEYKLTIALDITSQSQIERLRRVLTIYGFYPDAPITMANAEFNRPWREKEAVRYIVYSRLF